MNGNQLIISFSLNDLLLGLLCIAGIVALVFLILVLSKLSRTASALAQLFEQNQKSLDQTLEALPGVAKQGQEALTKVNDLLEQSSPNLVDSVGEVKKTLGNMTRLTSDVSDTVEYVAASAVDTVDSVTQGLSSSAASLGYIKEVIDILRGVLKK